MVKRNIQAFLFFLTFVFLLAGTPAFAAVTPLAPALPATPDTLYLCEKFYNSRAISFRPLNVPLNAIPGHVFKVNGVIQNTGNTSFYNTALYASVKKDGVSGPSKKYNEYIQLQKSLDIKAHSTNNIEYSWNVPVKISSGKYIVDFFLVVGGNTKVPLSEGIISTDVKNGNNQDAVTMSSATISALNSQELVAVSLKNNAASDRSIPVTVKIYDGDFAHGEPVQIITKSITLKSQSSILSSFSFFNYKFLRKTYSVEFPSEDEAKNIYQIVQVGNPPQPRLSMAGLDVAGKIPTAFACIDPFIYGSTVKTRLLIRILNKDNSLVQEHEYQSNATTTGGAIKVDFLPEKMKTIVEGLKIEAALYRGDFVVDKKTFAYKCSTLNGLCGTDNSNPKGESKSIILPIVVIALFLIILFFFLLARNKKKYSGTLIFLIMVCGSLSVAAPARADWRAEIKDRISNDGFWGYQEFQYEFGAVSGNYVDSLYRFLPYSGHAGNYVWSTTTASSTNLSFVDYSDPGTFESNPIEHMIKFPVWMGVYIVDQEPQFNGNFFNTDATGHRWKDQMDRYWVTHPDYPAQVWQIPLGTKIGFYVSPSQIRNYVTNYFQWYEAYGSYGPDPSIGEYSNSIATSNLGDCRDDFMYSAYPYYYYHDYLNGISSPLTSLRSTQVECDNDLERTRLHQAMRMNKPTVSITGLNVSDMGNFSCETIHADGTMECTAVSLGTSTPTVTINQTKARIFSSGDYGIYQLGLIDANYIGDGIRHYYYNAFPSIDWANYLGHHVDLNEPSSISPIPPARSQLTGQDYETSAAASTLSDEKPGISLPALTIKPFGQVVVVPRKYPPSAPIVKTLNTFNIGYGNASYLLSAVATDTDSNLAFSIDWGNDGTWDQNVYLSDIYYDATSSTNVNQPGYVAGGIWPDYLYTQSGSPLRFVDTVYSEGTSTFAIKSIDPDGFESSSTIYSIYTPPAPPPPDSFNAATAACDHGINLSWSTSVGATGYKLFRLNSGTGEWDQIATLGATSTAYQDIGVLDPDSGYYRLIAFVNNAVQSAPAESNAQGSRVCNALYPPDNFKADTSPSCGGKIDLSWNAATRATGYGLDRWDSSLGVWNNISSASTTFFQDTVSPGEYANYRINTRNGASTSVAYSLASGYGSLGNCNSPPSEPTGAIASASCGGHVTLSWTPSANTTGYFVYKDGPRIATTTSSSYADNAAPYRFPAYTYNIQSYNGYGVSTSTASASVTGIDACVAPNPPTGLIASGICYNRFNLSWNASNNSAGYELWRSTLSGGTFSFITALDPSAASGYKDTAGSNSQYFYKVKAYNGAGTSTFSIESTDNTQQSTSTCAATCLRDGIFLSNGQSHIFYQKSFVSASSTCSGSRSAAQAQTFTGDGSPVTLICSSGTLFDVATGNADPATSSPSGTLPTYRYGTCRVNPNFKEI